MNWIFEVSAAERSAGQLSPGSTASVSQALRENGAVLLRHALAADLVDTLKHGFDSQWGAFTSEQMRDQARLPFPNPVLRVGEERYEVILKIKHAFLQSGIFANDLICNFLVGVLGPGMKLSGFTAVLSFPGAKQQHIHSDAPRLFNEAGPSASLPSYAINVSIPLIDVTNEIGGTGIWLGSHQWDAHRAPQPREMTNVEFQRGDCILMDYRTLHAGLPNVSTIARPILYMVYARPWFFDDSNHVGRPSLDMDTRDFERLAPHIQNLLVRAFSQRMRAQYLLRPDQ